MKRLVLLNDTMEGGGAERAMATLVNLLAETGEFEILLVSLQDNWGYPLHKLVRTVALHRRYFGPVHKLFAIPGDALKLKRLVREFGADLILSFQNRSNFTSVLARMLGSGHRTLISERIYTPDHYGRPLKDIPARLLTRFFYPHADLIICNAADTCRGLAAQFGAEETPMTVVHNACDPVLLERRSAEALPAEHEALFTGGRTLITVGRLEVQKGHTYLLDAFARLPAGEGWRLVILGEGALQPTLERQAGAHGVADRVHFLGFQENPWSYMGRADVFVFPSLREGFPNALTEAALLGLPCVAFEFKAGVHEVLDDHPAARIVPLKDVDALASAIMDIPRGRVDSATLRERVKPEVHLARYLEILAAPAPSEVSE